MSNDRAEQKTLRGFSLSPGLARGIAVVPGRVAHPRGAPDRLEAADLQRELDRLHLACERAVAELEAMRDTIGSRGAGSAAGILEAQELLLRDRLFLDLVIERIRDRAIPAEAAVDAVVAQLGDSFDRAHDPYIRERGADIRDVGHRLQLALSGGVADLDLPDGTILVTSELSPSLVAALDPAKVRGVVTELGAKASHAAILLRSLGIPAVGAIRQVADQVPPGSPMLVDGFAGLVFVAPGARVLTEYERLEADLEAHAVLLAGEARLPAVTRDGVAIHLAANIGKSADTEAAVRWNADGVGLYRTEFAFDIRDRFPTEEEQAAILGGVAERLHPMPVVFRLLDIGAEKSLSYFPLPPVTNPALYLRGTRLLLAHPEILRPQLRAILRVSAAHPVSVLLPMIGGVEEVREVKRLLAEVRAELEAEGLELPRSLPLGTMIEVPSAALVADDLAREVDFLSLGTNDLVQYLVAADREEPAMASYYRALHPAVLRVIRSVAKAARKAGKELTICGEMAGDPFCTELLLGLGLRSFSIAPRQLGAVRHAIRQSRIGSSTSLARRLLRIDTRLEIRRALERRRDQLEKRQPAFPSASHRRTT